MTITKKQEKVSLAPVPSEISLVKEFTRHVLYGLPVSQELQAIIDDPERYKQFCEGTSLDPEIQEKFEQSKR
ncbi:MAG TPA: hypothetical protein VEI52_04730 [Terriglobales bacterium]|nr:hypothetical protein [Terriglobales bacterium]